MKTDRPLELLDALVHDTPDVIAHAIEVLTQAQGLRDQLSARISESEGLTLQELDESAEDTALAYVRAMSNAERACEQAIQTIAQELISRRVNHTDIAEAARVSRQTVARWKNASKVR